MDKQEILKKQAAYLWPNQLLYYSEPLPLERGEDMYVWDVEGEKYLDFFGGILTNSVGHNNQVVNQYIKDQVDNLLHTSTLYPHENQVTLAESLAEITRRVKHFLLWFIRHGCRLNSRDHRPDLYRKPRNSGFKARLQRQITHGNVTHWTASLENRSGACGLYPPCALPLLLSLPIKDALS